MSEKIELTVSNDEELREALVLAEGTDADVTIYFLPGVYHLSRDLPRSVRNLIGAEWPTTMTEEGH